MPNTLDASGLTVKSAPEIVNDLSAALQEIYGADINLDSDSPDGQLVNIFAQAAADMLELLADVYNSFSPTGAYGTMLDQRVALNGLARKPGRYTQVGIAVTASQAVTLPGQDTDHPFTVADNAGNQYQLLTSTSFGPGSATFTFACTAMGPVTPVLNTITSQITPALGISAVNNPSAALSIGVTEESDAELKIRHAKSLALGATGPADAIQSALANLPNVLDAYVVENATDAEVDGVPAYSIWCIVNGGADADIAQAIYEKKSLGCGMLGDESYVIARPNGTGFTAKWDEAASQRLYAKFTIHARTPGLTFDTAAIKTQLAAALAYKLAQAATVGDLVSALLVIEPGCYQTALGVSVNGTDWFDSVEPTDATNYFALASADITIT